MKKRGSLVFALCAMVGAVTIACSDDSGNSAQKPASKLTVEPTSMLLNQGDSGDIKVNYGPKMDLVITSATPDCVKVNNDLKAEATTNNEGTVTVVATAVGQDCKSLITVADKEDVNVYQNVNVEVQAAGAEKPVLSVNPTSLQLTPGGSDTAVANYKLEQSNTPIAKKFLTLESTNPACANPAAASVETDDNGNANIKVIASEAGSCSATINVIPEKGTSVTIDVRVSDADPGPGPVVNGGSLSFDPSSLSISFTEKTGNIVLNYKDGDGAGVANANVTFEYDETCVVSDKLKKAKTDGNGQIAIVLTAQKDDCSTTLTAKSGELTASADIAVTAKSQFDFTLETAIDESKYDKIGYLAVGTSDQTCAALTDAGLQAAVEAAVDEQAELNGTSPILSTYKMTEVSVQQKSVLALGKASSAAKDTYAYGCKDISAADDGKTVHLDLIAIPTQIPGEYDIVTNFDISSAFTKDAHENLVYVEEMNGGDWIKFVVNLFEKPIDTLIDFIWVNSISRLAMIKDSDGNQALPSWLLNIVAGETGKNLVIDTIRPMLKSYLEQYGWYTIITTISPDIKDLVTNMQLSGLMTITKTDETGLKVTDAEQLYSLLQYQWSLKSVNVTCDDKAYHKDKTCRVNMKLKDNKYLDATISGKWTGAIAYDNINGDLLTIDKHDLAFKWATILYAAVFGEILPTALDYKQSDSIKKGLYIKGFLEKVLFDTIVKVYNDGRSEYNAKHSCTCDSDGLCKSSTDEACHSELKQTASCERFIEALVYMIYGKASQYASVIGTVAKLACSDQGIGQIEKLVANSLDKVQAGTFKIKSKDACTLYDEGRVEYQHLGAMDELVHSAYDVFKAGSKVESKRCTWEFALTDEYTLYGLFHAYRSE
ncbi:MAG: hypothetical protein J6A01_12520 [Proteobacteria bacterium]|nr:hypothetical protein [Pseudomonadota bacterium]